MNELWMKVCRKCEKFKDARLNMYIVATRTAWLLEFVHFVLIISGNLPGSAAPRISLYTIFLHIHIYIYISPSVYVLHINKNSQFIHGTAFERDPTLSTLFSASFLSWVQFSLFILFLFPFVRGFPCSNVFFYSTVGLFVYAKRKGIGR